MNDGVGLASHSLAARNPGPKGTQDCPAMVGGHLHQPAAASIFAEKSSKKRGPGLMTGRPAKDLTGVFFLPFNLRRSGTLCSQFTAAGVFMPRRRRTGTKKDHGRERKIDALREVAWALSLAGSKGRGVSS